MPRITVILSEPELERLIGVAQRERREPREQAALLIVRGLADEELRRRQVPEGDRPAAHQAPLEAAILPDPIRRPPG